MSPSSPRVALRSEAPAGNIRWRADPFAGPLWVIQNAPDRLAPGSRHARSDKQAGRAVIDQLSWPSDGCGDHRGTTAIASATVRPKGSSIDGTRTASARAMISATSWRSPTKFDRLPESELAHEPVQPREVAAVVKPRGGAGELDLADDQESRVGVMASELVQRGGSRCPVPSTVRSAPLPPTAARAIAKRWPHAGRPRSGRDRSGCR